MQIEMNRQQHFGESSQGLLNMQQLNLKQRLLNKLHYRGTCKKTFPTKHSIIINAFIPMHIHGVPFIAYKKCPTLFGKLWQLYRVIRGKELYWEDAEGYSVPK